MSELTSRSSKNTMEHNFVRGGPLTFLIPPDFLKIIFREHIWLIHECLLYSVCGYDFVFERGLNSTGVDLRSATPVFKTQKRNNNLFDNPYIL